MKKDFLISIIIPVYKVEKYLDKCVESIVNQTHKNLEIILVDDGSPDNCPKICDEWARKDKRIKVVHKKNGGLSSARNTGLDICNGEYIMFVDSDDYCDIRICEILLKILTENNTDLAMCGVQLFKEGDTPSEDQYRHEDLFIYKGKEVLDHIYKTNIPYIMTSWAKLYKRSLFQNLRFPVGKLHEDEYVFAEFMCNTSCFAYTRTRMYFYLQRRSSIMGTKSQRNIQDVLEAFTLRKKYLDEKMPQYSNENAGLFASELRGLYCQCKTYKDLRKKILKEYKDNYKNVICNKKDWLFYHFRWLYMLLWKIKNRNG